MLRQFKTFLECLSVGFKYLNELIWHNATISLSNWTNRMEHYIGYLMSLWHSILCTTILFNHNNYHLTNLKAVKRLNSFKCSLICLFNVFRVDFGEFNCSLRTLLELISLSFFGFTLLLDPHSCSEMATMGSGNNNNILWTFNTIHMAYGVRTLMDT